MVLSSSGLGYLVLIQKIAGSNPARITNFDLNNSLKDLRMLKNNKGLNQSIVFDILIALFITTLIVSNILSVKIVQFSVFTFDGGTILFPLAYIISDIITEIYGFKQMRRLIYIGIGMLALMSLALFIGQHLPSDPSSSTNQKAYTDILGVAWRIVLASMTALFFGDFFNSYILAFLKIKTKGKDLWLRVVGSTAIGSLIDTVCFSLLAFLGTISGSDLLKLIGTVYFIKVATEIIVSPLTLRAIGYIKKRENIDVFELPHLRLRG